MVLTIICVAAVFFFLGMLFTSFPYDYPLLWTKEVVDPSYFDQLETHLRFLHQSPPLIGRVLNIVISVGFLGLFLKLFRPSEANFLFDGASLLLYVIGVGVYISNTVKGLRTISSGIWDTEEGRQPRQGRMEAELILGRDDSLKVMAASNTILALVLIGVLVLQAGQWYAEKKELDDAAEDESKKEKESNSHSGKNSSSKKNR
jgi:hypothetical protein